MEHTKHIWRAVLILVVFLIGSIVCRHFVIPKSFGKEGPYRYDSLLEFMEKAPVHGESTSCRDCHGDLQGDWDMGKHATVPCETCHAPLVEHVQDGEKIAPMTTEKPITLCGYCHQALRAKPKDFPVVVVKEHLVEMGLDPGEEIPPDICTSCHDPHDPSLE